MENALIVIVFSMWMVREYQNFKERKDMLDRIMSADYREFKHFEKKAAKAENVRMTDEQLAAAEKNKAK